MRKKILAFVAAALALGAIGLSSLPNTIKAANGDGTAIRKLDGTSSHKGGRGNGSGLKDGSGRISSGGKADGSGGGRQDGTGPRSQNGTCVRN